MNSIFGVLGGDRRQRCLAASIAEDGFPVAVSCLGTEEDCGSLPVMTPEELAAECTAILLPLPATRDGKTLNAPFSQAQIPLDDRFAALFAGKTVYGGMTEKLCGSSPLWRNAAVFDYYAREELLVGNAFLTAEGAVGVAICETDGALSGSRCLVTGFGRIGKALCPALRGLGAQVDCCARKPRDLTAIRALGCTALEYREAKGPYDVIFNTVPALVLGDGILSCQKRDTLILELASAPGGVDREAARRLGLRVLDAPSLPGRLSPKAAGELIKATVYRMIEEH